MTGSRWIFAMMVALSVGTACSDDPTVSVAQPGTVVLNLTTPHPDDGAVLFEVSGPPIDSAIAVNASLRLFTRRVGGSTLLGALVGPIRTGTVVTLYVPDVAANGGHTARLLEVADRQDTLRSSLTGYALTVTP